MHYKGVENTQTPGGKSKGQQEKKKTVQRPDAKKRSGEGTKHCRAKKTPNLREHFKMGTRGLSKVAWSNVTSSIHSINGRGTLVLNLTVQR